MFKSGNASHSFLYAIDNTPPPTIQADVVRTLFLKHDSVCSDTAKRIFVNEPIRCQTKSFFTTMVVLAHIETCFRTLAFSHQGVFQAELQNST